jgi:hypothetical protein
MTTTMGAVTLYNASFEPLGRVSFKHAVRMLFREVAVVHEQQGDKMIGPHPWPKAVRLVRYIAMHWMYRPAGYSPRECSSATSIVVPIAAAKPAPSTTCCHSHAAGDGRG